MSDFMQDLILLSVGQMLLLWAILKVVGAKRRIDKIRRFKQRLERQYFRED